MDALGRAMIISPETVLPYINQSYRLKADNICLPFISVEIKKEDQLNIVRKGRRSVGSIRDHKLAAQKKACLDYINKVEMLILVPR